jgi:hypothetical protein
MPPRSVTPITVPCLPNALADPIPCNTPVDDEANVEFENVGITEVQSQIGV